MRLSHLRGRACMPKIDFGQLRRGDQPDRLFVLVIVAGEYAAQPFENRPPRW